MRSFAIAMIISSVALLSGCGAWSDEDSARAVCLLQALELKGDGEFVGNDEVSAEDQSNRFADSLNVQVADPSTFVLEPDGTFAIDYRELPSVRPGETFDIRCSGDFNRRLITRIEVDGRVFEPAADDDWSFAGSTTEATDEADVENLDADGSLNEA